MDTSLGSRICSFCGVVGSKRNRLAGGLGAMICFGCLERYHAAATSPGVVENHTGPMWDNLSDAEVLGTLSLMVRSAEQNAEFVTEWVEMLRKRRLSWAEIGNALGVSRQAAWVRYSKDRQDLPKDVTA